MADIGIGLIVGLVLIFPLVELLRFVAAELIGVYGDMTLTEAFLGMIVILLTILVVRTYRILRATMPETSWGDPPVVTPPRPPRRTTIRRPTDEREFERTTPPRRITRAEGEPQRAPRRTTRSTRSSAGSSRRTTVRSNATEEAPRRTRRSPSRRRTWRAPD
ncbi:MAG: hypothetical protein HPY44_00305 [Armatimonadetes bacterium]|nr:hypothetical protein [Armatimonadota bacterium]